MGVYKNTVLLKNVWRRAQQMIMNVLLSLQLSESLAKIMSWLANMKRNNLLPSRLLDNKCILCHKCGAGDTLSSLYFSVIRSHLCRTMNHLPRWLCLVQKYWSTDSWSDLDLICSTLKPVMSGVTAQRQAKKL